MFRPDLSADALLRRHQNPAGMVVRGLAALVLVIGLWTHAVGLILLAVLIEAVNWLFLPAHDSPPEWLEQVLDMAFALLDMPPSALRMALAAALVLGLAVLSLGLWAHHVGSLLFGLLVLAGCAAALRILANR